MTLRDWGIIEFRPKNLQLEKKAAPGSGISKVVSGVVRTEFPGIKLVSRWRAFPPFRLVISTFLMIS
jgi:hypothetical protein